MTSANSVNKSFATIEYQADGSFYALNKDEQGKLTLYHLTPVETRQKCRGCRIAKNCVEYKQCPRRSRQ